jgi:hypothetical protein
MTEETIMYLLRRWTPLSVEIPTAMQDRSAWIGVYPLNPNGQRMAGALRSRRNFTVIQFDVPKSMSGMFQRGFIGEFRGAPFIDIGTGHELLLSGAANVLIFNAAILTQTIRVKRWRFTGGGAFDEY